MIGKLRVHIECEIDINDADDLEAYEAGTLEEAADNLMSFFENGEISLFDLGEDMTVTAVEPVKE